MSYGVSVFDSKGVQTFGMQDFTLQLLYSMVIAARNVGNTRGRRTDCITIDVPGYDPATGVVIITPNIYANYEQGPGAKQWGVLPTYKDLGGSTIGIYTYANYRIPDNGGGGKTIDVWSELTVECTVEVFRVL